MAVIIRSSFLLPVVLVIIAGVGNLMFISSTNAETTEQPREVPESRHQQYYGTERIGTMAAVIMACVIVPLGVFGFIMILICNMIIRCKKSRQAQASSSESKPPFDDDDRPDEVKQWSDLSDTEEEEEKEVSTFYMFIDKENGQTYALSPANI